MQIDEEPRRASSTPAVLAVIAENEGYGFAILKWVTAADSKGTGSHTRRVASQLPE